MSWLKTVGLGVFTGLACVGTYHTTHGVLQNLHHTRTLVVCTIPSIGNVKMHVDDLRIESYGFSGKDENGNRQFYMKSMMESCFSVDEEILEKNASKNTQTPLQRNNERSPALDVRI